MDGIFKLGDTVYCAVYGKGVVINRGTLGNMKVSFDNKRLTQPVRHYDADGRLEPLANPTLSKKPVTIKPKY